MSGLTGVWDQLVDAVCRPPRDDSYTDEDLLGGQRASFRLGKARYYRQDLEVGVCQRGLVPVGSMPGQWLSHLGPAPWCWMRALCPLHFALFRG